ncbi:hypothetical protein OH76DRAFT_901987 [Lentinus brumalis]|uniref:Uncharacterized protein n=1 Tax=Lentinus brumalis TaxID=2498619 RepID=A0A371D0X2_9APHY|nr:hypothetical protein OH76DRAFT_901987 [Polyporus brumalis]
MCMLPRVLADSRPYNLAISLFARDYVLDSLPRLLSPADTETLTRFSCCDVPEVDADKMVPNLTGDGPSCAALRRTPPSQSLCQEETLPEHTTLTMEIGRREGPTTRKLDGPSTTSHRLESQRENQKHECRESIHLSIFEPVQGCAAGTPRHSRRHTGLQPRLAHTAPFQFELVPDSMTAPTATDGTASVSLL